MTDKVSNSDLVRLRSEKWDARFLGLAEHIASWSKDPSTKCGAVLVDDANRVISMGYNGFPAGVEDSPELYQDRSAKYARIIHAEINAILFARQDCHRMTIYTFPFPPCNECAKVIVQAGIFRVVSRAPTAELACRWGDSLKVTQELLSAGNVILDVVNDEKECNAGADAV
jgi:dCMP deaminase